MECEEELCTRLYLCQFLCADSDVTWLCLQNLSPVQLGVAQEILHALKQSTFDFFLIHIFTIFIAWQKNRVQTALT